MFSINKLDKAFENRVRLGIMSVLTGSGQSDFNTLKSMLGVSDGNLASHIRALEDLGYIESIKKFIGRKPNTSYIITNSGDIAFRKHIRALIDLIDIDKDSNGKEEKI